MFFPLTRRLYTNNPRSTNLVNVVGKSLLPSCRSLTKLVRKIQKENDSPTHLVQIKKTSSTPELPVQFGDIAQAKWRIRDGIVQTPAKRSHFFSKLCETDIFFKYENFQLTGSFKERGARNALLCLDKEQRKKGVIAASAGNHALALAYHGQRLNIPVTCVMPLHAPIVKKHKCKGFGANVVTYGEHIVEAKEYALNAPEFVGMTYINGYDDPEILAGAGTIGMEILEEIPDVDAVVVPIGGAGLIAGIALAIKTIRPGIEVIGVEPSFCASYSAALKAGRPVDSDVDWTLADGLAVPKVGDNAFKVARHHVDRVILINENEIALGVLRLVEDEKILVEGGGAVGIAAMLPGGPLFRDPALVGKKVAVPLCGGNIDTTLLGRIIERGMAADGRLVRFDCTISDRPGGLSKFTSLLASLGVSIKNIIHERAWVNKDLTKVHLTCTVETSGKKHSKDLRKALLEKGYKVMWNS